MAQSVLLKPVGLYTFPNHLSAVPQGAFLQADNIVINREGIAESRRGFKLYGNAMGSGSTTSAHQLLSYKNRLIRHFGTGSGTSLEYDSDGAGTFLPFNIIINGDTHSNTTIDNISSTAELEIGMFVFGSGIPVNTIISVINSNTQITISNSATTSVTSNPITFNWNIEEVSQGLRIKSVESNGNLYFTTSEGIRKISLADTSWSSSPIISLSGGVKALDTVLTLNSNPGFLTTQTVVAYRIVWGIKDINNNLILGTPSSRVIIRNTDTVNSKTVDLRITIPKGISTAYFYQVYRTPVTSDPSGIQDPGDEEQLVFEDNPTNTDLNNGYVSTTDITPESFRAGGANLYTNQNSGEGILQSNDIPPLATDITSFKGYTLYSNTVSKHSLNLSLLSVSTFISGTSTITITDGVTSNTYTFKTQTITCDTHSNTTIDNITDTSTLIAGQSISGTNIALGTFIVSIDSANSITVSQNTTATTVGTTFIAGYENISNKYINISQFATPAQQVEETARSLVHVINSQFSEIVYSYYLSGPTDVPGLLLLEAIKLNQNAFYITANSTSTGDEFSPSLPTSGSSVISSNETSPNRVYFSKFQQPEAVPLVNFIDVGPQDKAIIRILALRDSVFILKEDGVYRLSGLVAPFSVYPFDFNTIIKAPDSPVVLNNLIYLYSSQGIATISDTGVEVISKPIETDIIKLFTPNFTNFKTATFGISYLTDWSYYLFTVSSTSDTTATQCYKYNSFTSTWTKLLLSKRSGIVNPFDDLLYLGATDINKIEQERKSFDRTDFSDREIAQTLGANSISGISVILPSVTDITVGDILVQTQNLTIKQFNQLLSKLDNDPLLTPSTYVLNNTALAGDNLSNDLDNLIIHVRDDAGRNSIAGATSGASYTALIGTGSGSFTALQNTFNALIVLLNNDAGVGYKNYLSSVGTTEYEFIISTVNTTTSTITNLFQYPLIQGPLIVYNHIDTTLVFIPQYFQDVSMTKHVSEGTLIFEDSGFTSATLSYASDLSANFEDQTVSGNGNGIFGNNIYGNGIFGGNGSGIPFRTLLPKEKQRCRYINVKFKHNIGREIFSLYGLSLTFNPVSQRGWR